MASVVLDMRGVVLPICLLKCKAALLRMDCEEELDILINDPHVVEDLVKIIKRSQGLAVRPRREGDHYRLRISGRAGDIIRTTAKGGYLSSRQKN